MAIINRTVRELDTEAKGLDASGCISDISHDIQTHCLITGTVVKIDLKAAERFAGTVYKEGGPKDEVKLGRPSHSPG